MRRVRPFRCGPAPSFRTPSGPRRNDVFVARYSASVLVAVAAVALPGCGGSKNGGAPSTAPATTTAPQPAKAAAPSPLTPEAQSAATGDIPDNQVFLEFRDAAAGYAMKYPEGWAQKGNGQRVTFRDKNNMVRVVVVDLGTPQGVDNVDAYRLMIESFRWR